MTELEVSVVFGAIIGITYAVTGAGLVVIFRESGIINFAQGDIATAGLFIGYIAYSHGAAYWITALVVIGSCGLLGGLLSVFVIGPLSKRRGHLDIALLTIAISLIIQGIETMKGGGSDRSFPSIGTSVVLHLGSIGITTAQLVMIGVGAILFTLIGLFFRRTNIGVAMRAISDNPGAAALMGIPLRRMHWLSWTIASVCAGIAGLFVAPLFTLNVTSVDVLVIYGFIVIVLGGFDSPVGALVGGLAVGIIGNLVSAYLNSSYQTPCLVGLMFAILVVRPYGLFGRAPIERV